MANFIKCSCEKTVYHGHEITNDPINIELVTQVSKFHKKWYPDNTGIPALKFHGIDKTWVYENEQDRDDDYDKIVNKKTILND